MKQSKKMIRHWTRRAMAGLVVGSLCFATPGLVQAEEKQEFTFDPVQVTALRRESKDLATPAAVEVLTSEKIKATGAATVLEALKFTTGVTLDTYGGHGTFYSGMSGGVSIRGMGKDLSALVLLNGVPINLNGKYDLENIPTDSVERIEILKGASSTLYGSAAMGGVINIITKQTGQNSVSVEGGSFGTNRESVTINDEKFHLYLNRSQIGDMGNISYPTPNYAYHYDFQRDLLQTFDFTWKIADNITWNYRHIDDDYVLRKFLDPSQTLSTDTNDRDKNDITSLQIRTGSWLHKLYYNGLVRNISAINYATGKLSVNGNQYMQTYGTDSQSVWKTGFGTYTAGLSWQKDDYLSNDFITPASSVPMKQRDLVSMFGQFDHALSAKTSVIFGLRQDFIQQQNNLNNYAQTSPQLQMLHKLNKEQSLYLNVGKSFRAPNWTAMFSSSTLTIPNPSLEPDSGWTYEIGWKKIRKSDSLKIAAYKLDFSNLHQWVYLGTSPNGMWQSQNAQFRNLGMEIEYERSLKGGWGYSLGAMFGNPESMLQGADWAQSEAKLQLNAGVNYKKGKWSSSLATTYVGARQLLATSAVGANPSPIPPSLQANLSVNYDVTKNTQFTLRVENLFDRIDYTNSSGNITPGRAMYLKLTQNF